MTKLDISILQSVSFDMTSLWDRLTVQTKLQNEAHFQAASKNYGYSGVFTGTKAELEAFLGSLGLKPVFSGFKQQSGFYYSDLGGETFMSIDMGVWPGTVDAEEDDDSDPDDEEVDEEETPEAELNDQGKPRPVGPSFNNWRLLSSNPLLTQRVIEFFESKCTRWVPKREPIKEGTVWYLSMTPQGIDLVQAPSLIHSDLVESNYSASVLKKHNDVLEQIAGPNPRGKIAIYQGLPGTGKTFLIRNLLSSLGEAFLVLIQPAQVQALADPNFIRVIMRYATVGVPIVFVIEDADELLSPRSTTNISGISTLLNLGDGILGSLMDTRIVTSTNVKIEEFDPAIVRPGRLLQLINVGKLSLAETKKAILGLKADVDVNKVKKAMTLAECYEFVYNLSKVD
jgi:hypothetical protein